MISVDEFSTMIKNSLSAIQNVKVHGEIGKIVKSSKQHLYFDMKSKNSIISCVAWASSALEIESGQAEVMVRKMDFYSPYGKCQAVVSHVEQLKDETAHIATERAKLIDKLHLEGVIDREKNQIPDIIQHLVIITSHGSAAHYDMKQGVTARWSNLKTTVIHSSVQGPDALIEIPLAFQKAISLNPDVIICGRGGGSETDLQVFNQENVIRHFIHTNIPIISAIGHESDHSISDLVADVRAKTPTAAIEIAVKYTKQELLEKIKMKNKELLKEIENFLYESEHKIKKCQKNLYDTVSFNLNYVSTCANSKEISMKESMEKIWTQSALCIQEKYMILKYDVLHIYHQTNVCVKTAFDNLKHITHAHITKTEHINSLAQKELETYSPHLPLKRGFAFVTKNGKFVRNIDELQNEDELCVNFIKGNIDVLVKRCRKK